MNLSHELFTTSNPIAQRNATSYSDVTFSIYLITSIINAILGLLLNFYVLWLICKGKGISAEFFYFNLAFCEILNCLGSLGYVLALWVPVIVNVTNFFAGLPLFGRPLIQCLICIERYLAVLHPIFFLKCKPLRYRLACSALVWVIVIGFCVFCMSTLPRGKLSMYISVFLPVSLALFIINLSCSVAILKALKHPKPGQKGNDKVHGSKIKRKAINFILIITVSMLIQSVPMYMVEFLFTSLSAADFKLSFAICMVILVIMSYVNPILYISKVKKG